MWQAPAGTKVIWTRTGIRAVWGTFRSSPQNPSYSASYAAGAGLILGSLTVDFNPAAAVIEGCRIAISQYGIGA